MSEIALVIAIAVPVSLLLASLVWFGRKEQSNREQMLQAQRLKRNADDLLDALDLLILMDSKREVQHVLLKRVEYLYGRYYDELPRKEAAKTERFDATPYRHRIDEARGGRAAYQSDRELYMAQRYFNNIYKTLSGMNKRREISEHKYVEYRRQLRLTQLDKEVNTYAFQGDSSAEQGDFVTATHYYKAAKKLLIEFDLQYPEKNERIRELSQRSKALYGGEMPNLLDWLDDEEETLPNGLPMNRFVAQARDNEHS